MIPRVKVTGRINKQHITKRYIAGRDKALDASGSMVRQSAKRQFSSRAPKQKPIWSRVGTKDGRPVLAMEFRPPKAGKITSWKNPRGRGATRTGFLRTLIEYRRDDRRGSVVIGPMTQAAWLNKLQEFGGSAVRVLKMVGLYPQSAGKNRLLKENPPPMRMITGMEKGKRANKNQRRAAMGLGAYVGVWVDPAHTRRPVKTSLARAPGKVRPGRFMKKGLDEKRAKLAEKWRGQISGP